MFAYCGNNPVSRKDDGGEFWNVVIGAVVGAALSAASEVASQVINHIATGEKINWGDVATSAAGGAVYGGVMAATGSNTIASMASTATTSVINGIRNGDSALEIATSTVLKTSLAGATSVAPKFINKQLSGKYLKLNKAQKWLKEITTGSYRGKYERGRNYLPDVFSSGIEDFGKSVIKSIGKAIL